MGFDDRSVVTPSSQHKKTVHQDGLMGHLSQRNVLQTLYIHVTRYTISRPLADNSAVGGAH
jgi:hypothetical protein